MIRYGVTGDDIEAAASVISERRLRRETEATLAGVRQAADARARRDRLTVELDKVAGQIEERRTAGVFGTSRADVALLDKLRRLRAERGF